MTSLNVRFVTGAQGYTITLTGASAYTVSDFVSKVGSGLGMNISVGSLRINGSPVSADQILTAGSTVELVKESGRAG